MCYVCLLSEFSEFQGRGECVVFQCLLSEFSEFQGRGECVVFVSFQSSANSRAGVNVLCLSLFRVQRIPGQG